MSTSPVLNTVPSTVVVAPKSGAKAGMAIVVFFLMWAFIWILLFSFRPGFFRYCPEQWPRVDGVCDNTPCDPAKALVGSLIITLVIMIIVWLVMAAK